MKRMLMLGMLLSSLVFACPPDQVQGIHDFVEQLIEGEYLTIEGKSLIVNSEKLKELDPVPDNRSEFGKRVDYDDLMFRVSMYAQNHGFKVELSQQRKKSRKNNRNHYREIPVSKSENS